MKIKVLMSMAFLLSTHAASAVTLDSIVLGVNLDSSEQQFQFPCTVGPANVVFCGDMVSMEDSECAKSISYKNTGVKSVDISCTLKDGRNVVLARAQGELTVDPTQGAFGFVDSKLNPDISVKSISSRRGYHYILSVK